MMLDQGILEDPEPDFALGIHLWNTKPVGWLGIAPGARMAAADIIGVEIIGKGGHGAVPHLAQDPIIAAAHVITALQTIVSRDVDSEKAAVLSLTEIHGGETFNVIPEKVRLSGTVRSFDPQVRKLILKRLEEVTQSIASGLGCQANVEITPLTPALVNDPGITETIQSTAQELFPDAEVDTLERIMGSEDMAIFLEKVPGCYIFVGSGNPSRGLDASHHNPQFNFDEQALPVAVNLLCNGLWKLLEK
jgi:amidohydrolase